MSGFVANASPVKPEPPIVSGTFWPQVELAALRAAVRIPGDVPAERLRAAAVQAVIDVNTELERWALGHIAAGISTLAAVPSMPVDGKTKHELLYLRAVYSATAVELHERYRSYDATAQGNQRADDLTPTIDEVRRDLRYAVTDILGTRRVTAELI